MLRIFSFSRNFLILVAIGIYQICSASEDLNFIVQQIQDNHPGIYNQEDPNFKNHLAKAYERAKLALDQSKNSLETRSILTEFVQSFQDGHLCLNWHKDQKTVAKKNDPSLKYRFLTWDIVWVELPTFDLSQTQENDLQILLKEIPKFKKYKAVIFDLRGNSGGNSGHGSKIIAALYGKKYAQQQINKIPPSKIDWRASPDNLKHMRYLYDRYHDSWMLETIKGMKAALQNHQLYYTEYDTDSKSFQAITQIVHDVSAQVLVIIDSHNASAALDFLDEIKLMDSSVPLIGKTTKADRLYMEVRSVDLLSGLGSFWFPIKVYRHRQRGDNIPYTPDIDYPTNSTQRLEKFIQTTFLNKK